MKKFISDNNAPVHEKVMEALMKVNHKDTHSYGHDEMTKKVKNKIKGLFNTSPDIYFVTTGTAANILSLAGLLDKWEAVICAETAHINTDEAGAFEAFTGNKLITIKVDDGKLTPEIVEPYLITAGNQHRTQIKVVSISNVTETGTIYSPEEVRDLADFCHENNLYLHLDGARIMNACVRYDLSLKEMTEDLGVDVLSFGGTKNGLMSAEAVVVFERAKSEGFLYLQKQMMQLLSKYRYLAAQFDAYLEDDLYIKNANLANIAAKKLKDNLEAIGLNVVNKDSFANMIFVDMSDEQIFRLEKKIDIFMEEGYLRLVTSFDTEDKDIEELTEIIKSIV